MAHTWRGGVGNRSSVAEQAAATPGAQLTMLDGYDHNAPPEVITPILIDFFAAHR